jgi:hypothetical protein
MSESAKPNNENLITSRLTPGSSSDSERSLVILSWISDELTILAEAFGEPLTEQRVEIYASGLADIPQDRLQVAFKRARYELTWFPKLAELRNLAGAKPDDQKKVEADAAWNHVNEYLRKWGVDRLPIYSGGNKITAPRLDTRSEYALRRIGGRWALNQMDAENRPFMYRDFCEAYILAPVAELMAPQLLEQFGDRALVGNVKQLTEAKTMEQSPASQESPGVLPPLSRVGELSPERKAELRQKLNDELAKRKQS